MASYSPGSDITVGGWTAVPGGALYSAVGEEPYNDQNWIQSSNDPSSDTFEVKYAGVANPGSLVGNFVNYRLRGDSGLKATVNLVCGTTIIASWTHDPAPTGATYTPFSQQLTQGQAASIADWSDLRLRITADRVAPPPPPPPSEGLFPSTYTIPTYQEYAFSDAVDWDFAHSHGGVPITKESTPDSWHAYQIPPEHYQDFYGTPSPSPGFFMRHDNAPIKWKNKGGDWCNALNVPQDRTNPFAHRNITTTAAQWLDWDIYSLVSKWLDGTYKNAGLRMHGSNSNTKQFTSRFGADPSLWPYLRLTSTSLGTINVPCSHNVWLSTSSEGARLAPLYFNTTYSADAGMLWFDLSPYSLPDITAAVLWVYMQWAASGANDVSVMRVVNPADQTGDGQGQVIDTQHAGLAASYPKDVGIEQHPDVLFVQKFTDGTIQPNGMRAYDLQWIGDNSGWTGTDQLVTAADAESGFYPIAGMYNAIRVFTGGNNYWQARWSPWRGNPVPPSPLRLKPYQEVEELHLRYYLMWSGGSVAPWNPLPNGGKMPGFDGRYADLVTAPILGVPCRQLDSMGRGNSGSGTDGLTGWSARGNFDRMYTPGEPMQNYRGLGSSDIYHADMSNTFGDALGWDRNFLGMMKQREWNCVELHVKLNTVSMTTEVPRRIASWTQVNGVCTVVLTNPEPPSAFYQVGQVWAFGGAGNYAWNVYNGEHTITSIIDDRTFTYDILPVNTPSPAIPGAGPDGTRPCWFLASPSVGHFDGIVEGWVNGRKAAEYSHIRFRHSRLRPDGGLFGVDAVWLTTFNGGADPAVGLVSFYVSNVVVSKSYIGPMYIPPSGPTMPAWYPSTPLTWAAVGSDGNSGMDNIANSPDYHVLTDAGLAPLGAQRDNNGYTLGNPTTGIFGSSGGTLDASGTTMIVWGGGGAGAWAGNEVRTLDLMQDNPVWRIPSLPSPYNQVVPRYDTTWPPPERNYDGKPVSRHSYWRPQFIQHGPYANSFFVFGHTMDWARDSEYMGDATINGRVSSMDWVTKTWRLPTEHPACGGQLTTYAPIFRDPATSDVYVWTGGVWRWSAANNVWSWIQTLPYGADHGMPAVDTDRNLMVRIGPSDGGNAATWTMISRPISTTSATFSTGNLIGPAAPGGTDPITVQSMGSTMNPYLGFVYDSGLKAFLLNQASGVIFKITANGLDWYCETLCAAPAFMVGLPGEMNAIVGRMQYIPKLKGIAIVWSHQPTYFLRTS